MQPGYIFQKDYQRNDAGYFGAVTIIIGTVFDKQRVVRVCRDDKEAALNDAEKLASYLSRNGVNAPIYLEDYL